MLAPTFIIPLLALCLTVLTCWTHAPRFIFAAVVATLAVGSYLSIVDPIGWIGISVGWVCLFFIDSSKLNLIRGALFGILMLITVALFTHHFPGFHNPLLIDTTVFSPAAIPYRQYLNFDKTLGGVLLLGGLLTKSEKQILTRDDLKLLFKMLPILALILLTLSLMTGFIRWDPKWPAVGWIWAFNNLFFVCTAEEALFRGVIQEQLRFLLPSRPHVAIAIAAVLFGLAHVQGGPIYVGLATVAGIFYGFIFMRTQKILAPILLHFALNLTHFLLFTYPALQQQ